MATLTATVLVDNGAAQEITIQADNALNARAMLEHAYGRVLIGPVYAGRTAPQPSNFRAGSVANTESSAEVYIFVIVFIAIFWIASKLFVG